MQIRKEQGTNSFQNLMSGCDCAIPCYCNSIYSINTENDRVKFEKLTRVSSVEGGYPY